MTKPPQPMTDARSPNRAVALWAFVLVSAFLGSALYRLAPHAWQPIEDGSLTSLHWVLLISFALFNAYAEGYRGFQKRFSPRVVGRIAYLAENPEPVHVVLALPFSLGLYHSTRAQMIVRWILVLGITALVVAMKFVPQPWRGIVDVGVLVGLGWGLVSFWLFFARWWTSGEAEAPQLPEPTPQPELA